MKVFGVSLVTIILVIAVWYVARKTNVFRGAFPPLTA